MQESTFTIVCNYIDYLDETKHSKNYPLLSVENMTNIYYLIDIFSFTSFCYFTL